MEREGSSKNPEEVEKRRKRHSEERRKKSTEDPPSSRSSHSPPPPPPPPRKRKDRKEEVTPENAEDEWALAEAAGARNYPPILWNRLMNPAQGRSTIDVWEFKMEGDVITMGFTCEGEKYSMYFSSRSGVIKPDYKMRVNYWTPRHNPVFSALRTRIYSLPKTLTINKLIIHNSPECEVEDCILELQFIKKWTCKQLEYNLCTEFSHPQHLRRLVHMFKPTDIQITLIHGPYLYNQASHEPMMAHNHLCVNYDTTVVLEKDLRIECQHALNSDPNKKELQMLYGDAGRGRAFGVQMLRTLCSLRKFVTMMADRKMAQTKGMAVRRFVVNGPPGDKMCGKMQQLLKDDGMDEGNKKRTMYAHGEKLFICVRNDLRRAFRYSMAFPASAFKMEVGNDQLLGFTKNVPVFHCLFRTNVDANGVLRLIEEWHRNDRNFDDIQIHVDKVIDVTFIDHLGAEHADKRIKLRRCIGNRRHTLYIERDRLATRHLSIRVQPH
uniref:DUF223 domain-containing protein n=1 Tax=Caenorhabditis tropicalis TaxID=1561998 RepID=A0A1I7USQ6_9PELO